MGFFGAIKSVLSKYATFSGRAPRSEYWWWILFVILWAWIPIVNIVLALVFLLPSLAVQVRRLHDIGRSGWWWFIGMVPIIGGIVLLVFYLTDSQTGENQYGPNPKEVRAQKKLEKAQAAQERKVQAAKEREAQAAQEIQAFQEAPAQVGMEAEDQLQRSSVISNGEDKMLTPEIDDKKIMPNETVEETVFVKANPEAVEPIEEVPSAKTSETASLEYDGQSFDLTEGRNIIGRKAESSLATIQIPTDDKFMSRQHCIINVSVSEEGELTATLTNFQNKNTTEVNGKAVEDGKQVTLTNGSELTLGHTTLTFKC